MKPHVLIGYSACPLTREAFERAGCEVWTCDLLPARGPQYRNRHIQADIWTVLDRPWAMAVLHPMCTYLTTSAAWAYKDPDYDKYPDAGYHQKVKPGTLTGQQRRDAREVELENFRRLLALPFPCGIENPGGSFINTAIRKPDQRVHPHQFGDDASKDTGLWLTHGLPPLRPTKQVQPRLVCSNGRQLPRWGNQTDSGQNKLSPSDDRWLKRSETYPGIAAAMGDQWGGWIARRARIHGAYWLAERQA